MMRIIVLLLSLFVTGTVASDVVVQNVRKTSSSSKIQENTKAVDTTTSSTQQEERDLQIDFGDTVCPVIEDVFQNLVECTCNVLVNFPISDSTAYVECGSNVCDPFVGSLCGDIEFFADVSLNAVSLTTGICLDNIKLFNFDLPEVGPFCIDYDLIRAGAGSKASSFVKSCTATVAGKQCNSCTRCDRYGGAKFDCSNVVKKFKTTTCARFRPFLSGRTKAKSTVPKIKLA
jgi:hypothetical protein